MKCKHCKLWTYRLQLSLSSCEHCDCNWSIKHFTAEIQNRELSRLVGVSRCLVVLFLRPCDDTAYRHLFLIHAFISVYYNTIITTYLHVPCCHPLPVKTLLLAWLPVTCTLEPSMGRVGSAHPATTQWAQCCHGIRWSWSGMPGQRCWDQHPCPRQFIGCGAGDGWYWVSRQLSR